MERRKRVQEKGNICKNKDCDSKFKCRTVPSRSKKGGEISSDIAEVERGW